MITFPKLGRYGQLGNQLFQIASTIGIAKRHGYRYGFPKWKNYSESRKPPEGMSKYFVNSLPGLPWLFKPKNQIEVPWGYHDISVEDSTGIFGYLQSIKYFQHCEDEIRHYFQLKQLLLDQPSKDTVAIHVRRGDYDGQIHPLLGEEYYLPAIQHFPTSYKFLVFSDDIESSKKLLGDRFDYVVSNHFMDDFYLMTQCDHFITANSTFSWWGAFLGDHEEKQVIAPKKWFGPDTGLTAPDSPDDWKRL